MLSKPFDEWSIEDIEQLLLLGERQVLECKASDALTKSDVCRNELSKDVSSFANSSGGYILYGVAENKNAGKLAIDQGVNAMLFPKEWLEDVILSNIRPRLPGLRIRAIPVTPGHVLYAVHIEEGTTAYQARDKRYYKRFNFKAEPMEDHEVKYLVGKLKTPIISLLLESTVLERRSEQHRYALSFRLRNEGPIRAADVKIEMGFPSVFVEKHGHNIGRQGSYFCHKHEIEFMNFEFYSAGKPIFPGEILKLDRYGDYCFRFGLDSQTFRTPKLLDRLLIPWRAFADDAAPREGTIPFSSIQQF